jgi:hypothetical protein
MKKVVGFILRKLEKNKAFFARNVDVPNIIGSKLNGSGNAQLVVSGQDCEVGQ